MDPAPSSQSSESHNSDSSSANAVPFKSHLPEWQLEMTRSKTFVSSYSDQLIQEFSNAQADAMSSKEYWWKASKTVDTQFKKHQSATTKVRWLALPAPEAFKICFQMSHSHFDDACFLSQAQTQIPQGYQSSVDKIHLCIRAWCSGLTSRNNEHARSWVLASANAKFCKPYPQNRKHNVYIWMSI